MMSKTVAVKADSEYIGGSTFEERSDSLITYLAMALPENANRYKPKYAMGFYAARLMKGVDTDFAKVQIEYILDNFKITREVDTSEYAFSLNSVAYSYFIAKDYYTKELKDKTKAFLEQYDYCLPLSYKAPNYELMTYGAGYLASEEWSDFKDAGNHTAQEIKEYTLQYINKYFESIPKENIAEHGPMYYAINMYSLKMLADFAKDSVVKAKAKMVIDWMMTSLAQEWNNGYWVGTSDRTKDLGGTITSPDNPEATAATGWLYFGGKRGINASEAAPYHTFFMAYRGDYKMPDVLYYIANDRKETSVYKESMLDVGLGTATEGNRNVKKYTYQSQNYGLSSAYDFTASPYHYIYKEMRRTVLKWVSDKSFSTFAPMQDNRSRPQDKTANALGYGENPFQQVLQNEKTVIGVYNVGKYTDTDPNYGFNQAYAIFSKTGSIVKKVEEAGWIFCHAGNMLFAYKPIKPYVMETKGIEYDIAWSNYTKDGWILETSELEPYATGNVDMELERFKNDILTKSVIDATDIDNENPRLIYTSIHGYKLDLTYRTHGTESQYDNQCKINDVPVDFSNYPFMDSKWVHQDKGIDTASPLNINYKDYSVIYDFVNWKISETGIPLGKPTPVDIPIIIPEEVKPSNEAVALPEGEPWYTEDFEDGSMDLWNASSGSWSIIADGSNRYKQSDYDSSSANWAVSLLNSGDMRDANVSVKVKPLQYDRSSINYQYPFIGVRAADANNMYFVSLRVDNNTLEIRRRLNGSNSTLSSKFFNIIPETTYDVRVEASGNTICVYIDGVLQLTAADNALTAGKIALGTVFTTAEFDDVVIYKSKSEDTGLPVANTNSDAITLNYNIEADTFAKLNDNSVTNASNNGKAATVIVKNDGGNTRETYLRFDLSTLASDLASAGGKIQTAEVKLMVTKRGQPDIKNQLSFLERDDWNEETVTWKYTTDNFLHNMIKSISEFQVPEVGKTISIDVTPQAISEVNGDQKLSLKLTSNTVGTSANVEYGSKQNGTTSKRPVLTVKAIIPAISGALSSARINENYGENVLTSNISGSVTWSLSDGTLPAGLTLESFEDSETGKTNCIIYGTPSAAGIYSFKVRATNGTDTVDKDYTIPVYENPLVQALNTVFDMNVRNQEDLSVAITASEGNILYGIRNGLSNLRPSVDYMISGNICTIKKEYLEKQPIGTVELLFDFSAGVDSIVQLRIADTTIKSVDNPEEVTVIEGLTPVLPSTVTVTHNDNTTSSAIVVWSNVDTSRAGEKTVIGTVEDYMGTVNMNVKVIEKQMVEVTTPSAITVIQGLPVILPSEITVSYNNNTTGSAVVVWENVDTSIVGDKTVKGNVAGWQDPVSITVKVTASQITSVTTPPAIQVTEGLPPTLPSTLTANYNNNTTGSAVVVWQPVDTSIAGQKTVTGTVPGYTGIVTMIVNIIPAQVISIDDIAKITVKQGSKLTLPSTVTANLNNNRKKEVPVVWKNEANTDKLGQQIIKGVVDGYQNEVSITIVVDKNADPEADTGSSYTEEIVVVQMPSVPSAPPYTTEVSTADKNKLNEILKDKDTKNYEIIIKADTPVVDGSVFSSIKGLDKEVTFANKSADGTVISSWSFNGSAINKYIKDLDLTIKLTSQNSEQIKEAAKTQNVFVISFNHHGDLPGEAKVKVKLNDAWLLGKDKNNLTLYYYNGDTKKMELVAENLKVDASGYVEFILNHCSEYILVDKTAAEVINTNNAIDAVETALVQKTFYHYNTAYYLSTRLNNDKYQKELLAKLISISNIVWNEDIKNINNILVDMVKTASGKIYDEIQVTIKKANISEVDKAYLLGEVTSWGKKLVWTSDYSQAVELLTKAWEKKDSNSVEKAKAAILQIKNENSRKYLQEELSKIKVQ